MRSMNRSVALTSVTLVPRGTRLARRNAQLKPP
jgi:hypothetical protein